MEFIQDLLIVALLGLTHGFDPDHIATAKMLKKTRKVIIFALSHSLGFVLLAIPLSIIFILLEINTSILELAANIVGIIIGIILLISAITNKEFEIEPKSMGIIQGALVVTPSKILTIVLAITIGNFAYSIILLLAFILTSTISIIGLSLLKYIPERFSKLVNIIISIITIGFFTFSIIQGF
ncbi:hypothetical protein DFR86_10205 [Acidianus sulfidivorans JP7]|uniref:Nickel/cobalt efflux system n=1 Tax=Acidianus sulfidivorans JP7 TaxID=619593 RepID=A0A2U9IPE2_9CREN|nr:hypothetical protein [Acidianus sulfidivorans]AWR97875.1 hypothetical protein DFR86_10205 [Acidianus sulfidivorans JP7]